jgi:hypothetical protein
MKTTALYPDEGKCSSCGEYLVPVREERTADGDVFLICQRCDEQAKEAEQKETGARP